MRSFVFAVCLAVPATGVAAAAPMDYNPLHLFRHAPATTATPRPQQVKMTFRNLALHDFYLQAGKEKYLLRARSSMTLRLDVGATVKRLDNQDTRHDGEQVMEISTTDANRTVEVGQG